MSKRTRKKLSFASFVLAGLLLASSVVLILNLPKPHQAAYAADPDMIIFMDYADLSGGPPTDWYVISDQVDDIYSYGTKFYNRYVRGGGTFEAQAGNATHTHSLTYSAEGSGSALTFANVFAGVAIPAGDRHSHGGLANQSIATNDNLPNYRSLAVLRYRSGIPSTLPDNTILMFETDTIDGDWELYSAQDARLVRGGSSTTDSGNNTPTHTVASGLSAAADANSFATASASYANNTHTHSAGAGTATDGPSIIPPYYELVFQRATAAVAIADFPDQMIAGFTTTAFDSGDWTVVSDTSDKYDSLFLMGDSSGVLTQGGASTHSHTNPVTVTSGQPVGTSSNLDSTTQPLLGVANVSHTHTIDINLGTNVDHTPLYTDLVLAQYTAPAYTPETKNWRWYDAEDVADPNNTNGGDTTTGDAIAGEDIPASANARINYKGNAIKLRIAVGETAGAGGTDVKYKLQYDTTTLFTSPIDVDVQGGTSALWRYYDGDNVADDDAISTIRLSGSPSAGRHNEDASVGIGEGSTFDPTASTTYEHEFTFQNYNAANPINYYFRLQYAENSTTFSVWQTVALNGSYNYPLVRAAVAYDLEVFQAPANVQLGSYTWGGSGTLTYPFVASEEIVFWDKRGTGVAYDATVSSMSMSSVGDTIPGSDITWTSTTGVLYGSFASSTTGFTGNTGQTLDTDRDAYQAGTTTLPEQDRRGGFYFLPTMSFANLDSRDTGDYSGTLTITVI